MKRRLWVATFLTVTITAVSMELWAAMDASPNTVPWTDLLAENVPKGVITFAVAVLVSWLPGHFATRTAAVPAAQEVAMSRYAKAIVAVVTVGLTAAQAMLPMSATAHSYIAVGLAIVGAVGVYAVPNAPAPDPGAVRPLDGPPAGHRAARGPRRQP